MNNCLIDDRRIKVAPCSFAMRCITLCGQHEQAMQLLMVSQLEI